MGMFSQLRAMSYDHSLKQLYLIPCGTHFGFEAHHVTSQTSRQAMLQVSAAESHGEKAWHPAFSRAASPWIGLMLEERSVKWV